MLTFISSKQLPPQNLLAEEIIIGNIISNTLSNQHIINATNYNLFILEKHQLIYRTAKEIHLQQKNIHIGTIINQLWHKNILFKIGGITYITNILQKTQALFIHCDKNVDTQYFIEILLIHYFKRLFLQYSHQIIQLSYLNNVCIQQLKTIFRIYNQQINPFIKKKIYMIYLT